MKKTKKQISNNELSPSLLILEEEDAGSSDLLKDIINNTMSADVKMLINRWEDVVSEHTKTWGEEQWKSVSTEHVWEQITSRIKSEETVHFIQRNYDGTIRQFILHEGHMLELGNWSHEDWGDMYVEPNHMGGFSVPHKRTVLPIMLKALINVAVKQYHDNQTLIPFAATSANILSEHNHRAEAFVESFIAPLLKTIPQQSAGNVLKTLQDFLPFDMVQPFWIKMGVECAQSAWINKGIVKNDLEGTRTFFSAVVNLSNTHTSPKHVETIGSILFGPKVVHNVNVSGVGFCQALNKLLQIAPVDVKLFKKWCAQPSDVLTQNILTALGTEEKFAPYRKVVLEQCSPQSRNTFIRQLVHQNDTAILKEVAQEYIEECCETHLKEGNVQFVNVLIAATNLQLNENHWDMYWNMMENEYPALGRGLRAMMEKKMMSAAIVSTPQSTTKRKM